MVQQKQKEGDQMLPNFSNPRMEATFDNWPLGFRQKCTAKFLVECDLKRGQRVLRATSNGKGGWNAPKHMTYASAARIVDGDDGKTYILTYCKNYQMIQIFNSDCKTLLTTVHQSNAPELYQELVGMTLSQVTIG